MMESIELDSVIETLKERETALLSTIGELEQQVAQQSDNLKRVQDALAALCDKPASGKKKKRRASQKPSASKADVESALMGAKDSNPEANDDQLRAIAEKQLVEQGFSRSGLALRFKQVTSQLNPKESVKD